MIGIKTWLYNLSKTKIYIPKTLTSEVYDSVGGTSLDQIIEKNNNNISDAYSDKKTYAVGDYCIYNNSLYKCITEITTAESFNSAKWKLTSINDILGNSDISSIGDGTVTGAVNTLDDSLKSVTKSVIMLRAYGTLVNGVCDLNINGITENSIAIVCNNQGNSNYVISAYCTSNNIKVTVNNNQANGITEFLAIIKF